MLLVYIRQSWGSLRSQPLRSILTMLGIIIGVAAVITTVAIGSGAQQQVTSRIAALGTNLLIVQPARPQFGAGQSAARPTLTLDDVEALVDLPAPVAAVAPEVRSSSSVVAGRNSATFQIVGTTGGFLDARGYRIATGRMLAPLEEEIGAKVAVLGSEAATALFGPLDPLGEVVRVGSVEFEVIGVLAAKGVSGAENRDDTIVVPAATALRTVVGGRTIQRIYVAARSPGEMDEVSDLIKEALRRQRRLTADRADDFEVANQQDLLEASSSVAETFTLLLAGIAAISLLVGGIGVMNIMLVSVTERTREIGIRKAVGATRSAILWQFLIEALALSLAGGMIGIGVGVGSARAVSTAAGWPTVVSAESVALAFLVALGVGLFFGLYPARRAASMSPLDALRHE